MKLFQYDLEEWKHFTSGTNILGNWYRRSASSRKFGGIEYHDVCIGLLLQSHLFDKLQMRWRFDMTLGHDYRIVDRVTLLWNSIYSDKLYRFDEIELGKQDIDHLIEKVNRLKMFL